MIHQSSKTLQTTIVSPLAFGMYMYASGAVNARVLTDGKAGNLALQAKVLTQVLNASVLPDSVCPYPAITCNYGQIKTLGELFMNRFSLSSLFKVR